MQIKIGLVILLFFYHLINHHFFIQLQNNKRTLTCVQFRYWNELATLFLFSITFLAVLKNIKHLAQGIIGMGVLIALLVIAIKLYKKRRNPR